MQFKSAIAVSAFAAEASLCSAFVDELAEATIDELLEEVADA